RHDLPKATSTRDTWPLLAWLAACLFLADVFTRRVAISLAWAPVMAGRLQNFLLRRRAAAPPIEYLERLRSRKAEVTHGLDQRRAAVRFGLPDADTRE